MVDELTRDLHNETVSHAAMVPESRSVLTVCIVRVLWRSVWFVPETVMTSGEGAQPDESPRIAIVPHHCRHRHGTMSLRNSPWDLLGRP